MFGSAIKLVSGVFYTDKVSSNNWFCVEMEPAARASFLRLCRQFQRAFMRAGAPDNMALFARTTESGEAYELYFSPECESYVDHLIEDHDGVPCRPPQSEAMTLLFGIPDAKSQLMSNEVLEHDLDTKSV